MSDPVDTYAFADLVDTAQLQRLMDRFYAASGIPVGIIGVDGTIHVATGWQEICTHFHRRHPVAAERCRESDDYIGRHLHDGPYAEYRCRNGLWDIAVPIELAGRHLATLFVGQFHYADDVPDREFFRAQAAELGFEEQTYLAALDGLPVFTREKIRAILDYYVTFVNYLVDEGVNRLERRRAQQRLSDQKRLLSAIVEGTNDAIFIKDKEGRYQLVNSEVSRVFDRPVAEILGWDDTQFLPPSEAVQLMADDRRAMAQPGPTHYAEEMTSARGQRTFDVTKGPLRDEAGRVVGVFGIARDVTDLRRMQEELQRHQKLESLGLLAGGIAHDFNNILTSILGNVSMAREYCGDRAEARDALAQAEQACTRAAELAHQLLTFAKGGQPIVRRVSLRRLLPEAVSLALHGTNVRGVLELADDLEALDADEGQLSQAVHNLVINAVQAMPAGGRLLVRAENVLLGADAVPPLAAGPHVRLTFTDEGEGIPEALLGRVFDPFFTTKPRGTGLGLTSVHSIVTRHQGAVRARSTVGVGTAFELLLPSCGGAAEPHPEPSSPPPEPLGAGRSLLVMDDEEAIRRLLARLLTDLGYRVHTCGDGAEAIALCEAAAVEGHAFDGAIMDLTVPGGVGGVDAARAIRERSPGTRLVVSSGYSGDPVMADPSAYGFAGALAKPYRRRDVVEALRTVLEREGAQR